MDCATLLQHIIDLKEGQASLKTDVSAIKADASEIKQELNAPDGIKKRVTNLEHDRTRVISYAAAISFVIGFVSKLLPKFQ